MIFLIFFSSKIDNVYKLIQAAPILSSTVCPFCFHGTLFTTFSQIDSELLTREVSRMKATTCVLDPLPTSLFKSCFDSLCPAVLSIVNDSLGTGVVPAALKTATLTPVPKKHNADLDNLNNYRPISNLPFLAKILERVVALQLHNHLIVNNLFEPLQSGFRKFPSTETALVKVTNDLLIASDFGSLSILILLDLSAAFDTVNHIRLLNCLENVFGVSETVLTWFRSYLTDRQQFVYMKGPVRMGVPQGSILGPLLYSIYIFPLGLLLRSLGLNYHFYADDTKIYMHSRPGQNLDVPFLTHCISEIKIWMSENFLCLNNDKTEVLLIGSSNQLRKAGSIILNLDGSVLESQSKSKLKNLAVIFDSSLSFDYHVQYTVKNSFFHLRNIARLRSVLSLPVTERLINTLVFFSH